MKRSKIIGYARIGNFAFSFGITSVLALLLGFWGGNFLDKKFATAPLFMILGLLFGIFITFQALFSDLKVLTKLEEVEVEKDDEDTGK